MAKITYKIRSSKKQYTPLYLRFSGGAGKNFKVRLPITIPQKQWLKSKQQVKGDDNLNARLVKLNADILQQYNTSILNNETITLAWLKNTIGNIITPSKAGKVVEHNYFTKYVEHYIKAVGSTSFKIGLLKKNVSSKVLIDQIDHDWLNNWCKVQIAKGYSENYIGKQVQLIRRVLKHASKNGVEVKQDIYDFKKPSKQTVEVYLNEAELQLIFNHTFATERLNNVKRLFLVGCTTGLRVSDLMQIHTHVINGDYLEISQIIKTKQSLIIPLDPRIRGFIPLLRPISAPKFNKYIKELCGIVGINIPTTGYVRGKGNKRYLGTHPKHKLISSHTMRRSFASNLYGKVPTVVIMAITGHTTEQSFLTYIKKPQREFAEQLGNFYAQKYTSA